MSPTGAYERYGPLVYRYCRAALGGNERAAADATVETFRLAASAGYLGQADDDDVLTWGALMREAMRTCRSGAARNTTVEEPTLDRGYAQSTSGVLPYSFEQVRDAFLSLDEATRRTVWRSFLMADDASDPPTPVNAAVSEFVTALRVGGIPDPAESL